MARKKPTDDSRHSRRTGSVVPKHSSGVMEEIDRYVQEAAQEYHLPQSLLKAIIKTESNFNPHAVSPKGAKGLMQIMPFNFDKLDITDPFDLRQNIMGGARYLRQLIDYFKGDVVKAIAAYNAGPGSVDKARGIPDFSETRLFVQKVLKYYAQFNSQ